MTLSIPLRLQYLKVTSSKRVPISSKLLEEELKQSLSCRGYSHNRRKKWDKSKQRKSKHIPSQETQKEQYCWLRKMSIDILRTTSNHKRKWVMRLRSHLLHSHKNLRIRSARRRRRTWMGTEFVGSRCLTTKNRWNWYSWMNPTSSQVPTMKKLTNCSKSCTTDQSVFYVTVSISKSSTIVIDCICCLALSIRCSHWSSFASFSYT